MGNGQNFLGLQESPVASGLFAAQESGSYSTTGLANGMSYLINAEGGDRLTVDVRTAVAANSYPRIRISPAGGAELVSVRGTVDGSVQVEDYQFPGPGVYQITIYSLNSASDFTLNALVGRGLELEKGDSSVRSLARKLETKPVAGGFSAGIAGSLDFTADWFDLGDLAPGNHVNFQLETPTISTLAAAGTELALFRGNDPAPVATAVGAALSHQVAAVGRYRIRANIPDLQGKFLHFNGDGDQVNLGNPPPLQITGSQTIEFWIKPDDFTTRQNPYSKAYGGEGTMTLETDGTIHYYYGTNGGNGGNWQTFNSNARLRAGSWQHLALVRDLDSEPKQLRWYFNGKLVAEAEANYPAAVAGGLNAILGTGYAGDFRGALDEFRIWNVARDAAQIEAARLTSLTGAEPGLVAYYQFGEGSGNSITDKSPSGISGTIDGAPDWQGDANATLAAFASQGPAASYLLRGTVSDTVAPTVISRVNPVPISGQIFDGTTRAPGNLTSLRGNVGQSYLYTLEAGTAGNIWGTDLYTDDSTIGLAAIHSGALVDGEIGAVKVTIQPGERSYRPSERFGISSSSYGNFAGSYRVERYQPATPFTWDGVYPRLWVGFSEPIDMTTLGAAGAVTLKSAGPDGQHGTSDDVAYPLTFERFTWDNRAFFRFGGAILPPGDYRLTVGTTVKDRAGNAIAAPHDEDFTIVSKDDFLTESGLNNTRATADNLSTTPQPGVPSGGFVDLGPNVPTGAKPHDVELADLDGDGHLDAVVSHLNPMNGISIHPGNGDNTFGTAIEFPNLGSNPYDLVVADFNNNGRPDIAVVVSGTGKVAIFHNNSTPGAISFTRAPDVTVGQDPYGISAGDLNGDGFIDLVVANRSTNATTGRHISILTNDGTGGFTVSKLGADLSPRVRPWAIELADFNGDSHLDLVVGDMDNGKRIVLWTGNGDGTFGEPSVTALGSNQDPSGFAVADFNGDGKTDLAVITYSSLNEFSVMPGNGDGTFGERVVFPLTNSYYYNHFVKTADLNGDGAPDLMFGGDSHFSIAINRNDGTFGFDSVRHNWSSSYGFAAGDLNGDGVPDIVVSRQNDDNLRVLHGLPSALLAADDTVTDILHGYGRGFLSDNSDVDHWRFQATRGQLLTVAADNSAFPGNGSIRFRVYDEAGDEITTFVSNNSGQGNSSPVTIPRDGVYYVRVEISSAYYGEYRFRVSLMPPGTQLENETNNGLGQSNPVTFALQENQLSATIGGYLAGYDNSGDWFNLGNLAAGIEVTATLRLPSTSPLTPTLTLYKTGSTEVAMVVGTELTFTLQPGDESTYYVRVTGGDRGLMSEYFLDLSLAGTEAPTIVADTLPTEGASPTFFGSAFTLTFSGDMLPATVRDAANYQLLGSGGDGTFDDGNEVVYTVVPGNYSAGLTNTYFVPNGPLQPDSYRFTVAPALRDKLGNALDASYVRSWTIDAVPGFVLESRSNDTFSTADDLSLARQPGVPSGAFADLGGKISTSASPFAVELADLDGDGNLDAVVTHHGSVNGISIHPGNGDQSFGTAIEFPGLGSAPYDLVVADFNNNGLPDIAVVISGTSKVAIFYNGSTPGAISFTRGADVSVGQDAYRIASGDLNGDGFIDLVVSNRGTHATNGRHISILTNDGSGGFTESKLGSTLTPRVRPWAIALADFNGDSHLDLVVGDMDNGKRVVLWPGNGDGSFGEPLITALGSNQDPAGFAVADFNGDGKTDLAVITYSSDSQFSVLPGNGDGTFAERIVTPLENSYYYNHFVKTADVNGDGAPDLMFGGDGHFSIATNRNDGTFGFDSVRRGWSSSYGFAAGDLDDDGILEIVVARQNDGNLRVLSGLASAQLLADDTAHGILHGYGRGSMTDNTDLDYWRFQATRGQLLTVAADNSMFSGDGRLRFRIYDEVGTEITTFVNSSSYQGNSSPVTIPRDGAYFVRVEPYADYRGEYRFRISLMASGTQLENESNNSLSQANSVAFTLQGNQLSATLGGYIAGYDSSGDWFNLGNLAAGIQITANLRLPSTSPLTPTLTLFKTGGAEITTVAGSELTYTLQPGDESTYYVRVTGDNRGLMSEYFLDLALAGTAAPEILADTLPAEGSSPTFFGSAFALTFSGDLLASTVRDAANYQLIGSGGDGTFGDGNEVVYTVVPGNYSSGLTNTYFVPDGPLQPDSYRFTVAPALQDTLGNTLEAAYVRTWTIGDVPGYVLESRSNNTLATADDLSLASQPGVPSGSFANLNRVTTTGERPYQLETADFDGDGNMDVVVVHQASFHGISIHPGNGDKTFGAAIDFPSLGNNPHDVAVADFNGDGKPDLAVTVSGTGKVVIFLNHSTPGAISFLPPVEVAVGNSPYRIAAGDLTGNGVADLVVANNGTNATTGRSISVLLNNGAGGFSETRLGGDLSPRVRPSAIGLADLNGDSKLDLVVGDIDNGKRVVVWLGNGNGSFGAPSATALTKTGNPSGFAFADFNGNGHIDVAFVSESNNDYGFDVLPGLGDGGVGSQLGFRLGYGYNTVFVKAADFNGDGVPDLLMGGDSHLTVATNRGGNEISFDWIRYNLGNTYGVAAADLDGDGVLDVLAANLNNGELRVLDGVSSAPLASDDSATDILHGYGRGFLTDSTDVDYWRFQATRGQLLTVAADNSDFPGDGRLRFRIYDEAGTELTTFVNSNSDQGNSSPVTIPRDGSYFVRVEAYADYRNEYRFRVSLMPPGTQLENETNNNLSQANPVIFALQGNQLSATLGGYLATYDSSGDWFNLGNLAGGTEISATLRLPSTSPLTPTLTLYKTGTTEVATVAGTSLTQTTAGESTYYIRVTGADRGLMAEYFLDVTLVDTIPPAIVANNLPTGTTQEFFATFNLTFNKDMMVTAVNNTANYSLVNAGPDGFFETTDDVEIPITPGNYTGGLTNSYTIPGAPLQPGDYRFTVGTGMRDQSNNPLPVAFVHEFSVSTPAGYTTENEPNNSVATANSLTFNDDIAGYLTANARGALLVSGDQDYWKFDAQAGDLLSFEVAMPFDSSSNRLSWHLTDPDGTTVFNRSVSTDMLESNAPSALTKSGTYTLRISEYHGIRTEYRFRTTLLRGMAFESESNNTIATANLLDFVPINGILTASVAGFVSKGSQLDYFDLGVVEPGNTVFVTVRRPAGSILAPIVSLYSADGQLQPEINGVAGDASAEVQITTAGRYYALIRANLGTAGINGDYVLDVRSVPTSSINFPNLRVTQLDEIASTTLQTGDPLTIHYEVSNVGTLGTGASSWVDRIVISRNSIFGDADDIQLAVIPRTGALAPGENYAVTREVTLPHGLPGDYFLFVHTDSGNAVDEALFESDNTTSTLNSFPVQLRDYPDLVIEDLAVADPNGSGNYDISWTLANRGAGSAPVGQETRIQVVNVTTSQIILDETTTTTAALPAGGTAPATRQINAQVPGYYTVTLTADPNDLLYEFGANGHAAAEQNTVQTNFQIFKYHEIQVAASPTAGGTVTGAGLIRDGSPVTVTATADTSNLPYTFVNWTENGAFVSSQASYTFVANRDRNLVAVFTLPQFFVAATASPAGSGTVSGGGTFPLGSTVSLTATPAVGYAFDFWEENGASIGTDSPLEFTLSADRTIRAVFREMNLVHAVTIATEPAGIATIPGAGDYHNDDTIDITAPAAIPDGANEYVFQKFQLNGSNVSGGNHLVKTVTTADPAEMHYVAVYTARSWKPVVASVTTNHPSNVLPLNAETRFTVTFDRDMDQAVAPSLALASGDASEIPLLTSGSWTGARTWRSGPLVFTAQNGGNYSLEISLAKDTADRVMDPNNSFAFTVDALLPLAAPNVAPASGTYNEAVTVTISNVTQGATIYYTTDGSDPTSNSQVYGGPFEIGVTSTVKVRATKAGYHDSSVVTRNYLIDAEPPLITSFEWNAAALENGATVVRRGILSATATDNQGIASAEFFYRPGGTGSPVLIGHDTQPGNGLTADWNIENISDGTYSVIARIYDTSGTWSETVRTVTVALAVPPAPQIVSPTTGTSIQNPTVVLTVQSLPNASVRIFRGGDFLFSGYANASGVFKHTANLPTGPSAFTAVAQNRAGASPTSNEVTVTRVREFPQLALTFDNNTVTEGSSVLGTITIPQALAKDLTVQVVTNKASRIDLVAPITIPAGSLSNTFTLVARQNSIIELLTEITVTATAPEFRSAEVNLFLADDDYPDIALELARTSVSEAAGTVAATIRREVATDRALRVDLVNSLPSRATVPAFINIPAGETSRTFLIQIIDNNIVDGNEIASLHGEVSVSGSVIASTPVVDLEIRDDEGPRLTLRTGAPFVANGGSVSGTVRRTGGDNSAALPVSLSHDPAGQLDFPATVTIPAGQDSASFTIAATAGSGTRTVTLRASAADYVDDLTPLTVSDAQLAELAVTNLGAPSSVVTEEYARVTYEVHNYGPVAAVGPYTERIFLSTDPSPGPDALLVRQIEQTGEVAAGGHYGRDVTVLTPRQTGTFYLIVTVDAGNSVEEIDETNNTTVLTQAIVIRPAYNATVTTTAGVVPANTPIVFTGTATKDNGQFAPHSMVNIHIGLNGSERVISAITNSIGQFSVTWTPLRNEGGSYTIGACHPGNKSAPVQDTFEILTLGFDAPNSLTMKEAESAVAEATLRNPNLSALTGLTFNIGDLPAGLTISPQLPSTTLAAGAEMKIPLTVTASAGFAGSGSFVMTVTSTEGVTMQALFNVRVDLLKPVLTLDPTSLTTSVLRGGSKAQSFTITNTGGLETGVIQVLLPDVPWMTLVSANPVPSIPPGGSASVSINLSPSVNVPLTLYTGNLALNAANGGSKSVSYRFRVVTDMRGDLDVDVVDEMFYFTSEAPKLAGARVTVRDAITSAEVASMETGSNGLASFPNLNEGWYRIDVSAPEHDNHSGNYYVNAGVTNNQQIFISKQLVKYRWTVEEVEIEDVYRVTVESTFETNVPAPVVTASPSRFDVADLVALGQSKIINVTLENHGFIAAQNSMFHFSDHPFYQFTPLVTNIGTIPAKSSLVVPVTITRVGVFGDDGTIVTLRDGQRIANRNMTRLSVPCGAAASMKYEYPCGPHLVTRAVNLAISGVQGLCVSGSSGGKGGFIDFIGTFYGREGRLGNFPGGGGGSGSSISFASPDPCLGLCLAQTSLDCLVGFTPLGCPYAVANCAASDGDPLTCMGAAFCWAGPGVNAGFCVAGYLKCFMSAGGGAAGGGAIGGRSGGVAAVGYVLVPLARSFAPGLAEAWERMETTFEMQELILGSKDRVLMQVENGMEQLFAELAAVTRADSVLGPVIDASEIAQLQVIATTYEIDWSEIEAIIERWNRTNAYYALGIFNLADVPSGQSTDFIPRDEWRAAGQKVVDAFAISREKGFIDPSHETAAAFTDLRMELEGNQGGVCARVKIQVSQDVVMTRTAFQATLELENERDESITEVGFDLQVRDSAGQPAGDLFNVAVTKLIGLAAVDGTGELDPKQIGTIQWTLIPRDTAALEAPTSYTIGGVIRYVQGGTVYNIPVANMPITVRPDASLDLKYFHQRDVFSDDPHTDVIEQSEPFKLAVMVENNGFGDARNLKIISGQPKIVENEKGLFIDFKIIGTEVDGQPLSPSLTAQFGTVAPGQRKIATWLMTSTLQGLFVDYEATFEHVTGLGDPRISLLNNVEIHEMIRVVRDQGTGGNGATAFLVNDVADANDYPDTIHYSTGGTDLVTVKQIGDFSANPTTANPTIQLDVGAFDGWSYLRLPDPGNGDFRLISVVRSDGRVLPMDFNFWQTDRTFIGNGRRPRYERILHIADRDSTGIYTLTYAPAPGADRTPPSSQIAPLAANSAEDIPVFWSGTDNEGVAFFDVFVSHNGAPFELWKSKTREAGAIFQGNIGSSYGFYSVATDHAGNVETKSAAAEATTMVSLENLPPVVHPIANQSINAGEIFTIRATANDPDGSSSAIRFSVGTNQTGVSIDPLTGVITWNTSAADGGKTANIVVVATDGGSPPAVGNTTFQVTVNKVNTPPIITQVGPQTLESGGILMVKVDSRDKDTPAQTLTFSLSEAPAGAAIHPVNGTIHWAPTTEQAGQNHLFTVVVTDDGLPAPLSTSMSFSVHVVAQPGGGPRFTEVPVVLWVKGRSYTLTVRATDPDGDPISLAANIGSAAGATFADQGGGVGTLGWDPTAAASGSYQISVTATAGGQTANATIRIRVEDDELYWTWVRDAFGDLPNDFDLNLLDLSADPDGDGRANVHEMAFLTNPLVKDEVPVTIKMEANDPFATIQLGVKRRKGSQAYVNFGVMRSATLVDAWQAVPTVDMTTSIHPDATRPEAEEMRFSIFEFHPGGLPSGHFYRIHSTAKPAKPAQR